MGRPLTDEEIGIHLKFGVMSTDILNFTDQAFRTLIEVLTTDTLVYDESLAKNTIFERTLADTLNLDELLDVQAIFDREFDDCPVVAVR